MGAFDGTADLLFRIGADPSDAQNNIARFRGLLSKDLAGMKGEFSDWADSVFGNFATVKGAMVGGAAAIGAALVATAAFASKAADRYREYVEQVDEVSDRTGIAAESVSGLLFAARSTNTSVDSLTSGLTIFSSNVSKAARDSDDFQKVFGKWGFSQKEVIQGQNDLLPLLYSVAQRFSDLKNNTDRAAFARDQFGRGGAQFLDFLALGSEGLKRMASEAANLGLKITEADIKAVDIAKAAKAQKDAVQEALDIQVGSVTQPIKTAWWTGLQALLETITGSGIRTGSFAANFALNMGLAQASAEATAAAIEKTGKLRAPPPPQETPQAAAKVEPKDWDALSGLLDQVRGKMAGLGTDEEKVAQDMSHLQDQVNKTAAEYLKLHGTKELSAADDAKAQSALESLSTAIPQLRSNILTDLAAKRKEEAEAATAELRSRITSGEEGYEAERSAWNREIDGLRAQYQKKGQLTKENEDLIVAIRKQGLEKIARDETDAFLQELVTLQGHLAQLVTVNMTTRERMEFERDQELAKYSQVEFEKTAAAKAGGEQRHIMEQQFAINRKAILNKYDLDLRSLMNSQGWQGVFGSRFAQLLRSDENALRLWATSSNQSLLMVKLSMVALSEMGKIAFADLAQGMGQGAASAIVYSKSVGEAMQAALAATLTSIAAEAGVQAIYALALGFLRLAQWDFSGAASAFTSAAIFGTIGAAAAVAGRAVAPQQGGAGSSGAGGGGATSSAAASGGSTGSGGESGQHWTVIVQGNLVGWTNIDEFTSALNDAVVNRDVRLISTATTSGQRLIR